MQVDLPHVGTFTRRRGGRFRFQFSAALLAYLNGDTCSVRIIVELIVFLVRNSNIEDFSSAEVYCSAGHGYLRKCYTIPGVYRSSTLLSTNPIICKVFQRH